jgi:hypothetical protein
MGGAQRDAVVDIAVVARSSLTLLECRVDRAIDIKVVDRRGEESVPVILWLANTLRVAVRDARFQLQRAKAESGSLARITHHMTQHVPTSKQDPRMGRA